MTTRWLLQPELQQPVSHARGAESKGKCVFVYKAVCTNKPACV